MLCFFYHSLFFKKLHLLSHDKTSDDFFKFKHEQLHPISQSASIHLYIFKVTRRRESSNRAKSKGSREDVTKNSHNRPSRNVHRIRLYILGPGEG